MILKTKKRLSSRFFWLEKNSTKTAFFSILGKKEERARLCKVKCKLSRLDVLFYYFYYLYSTFAIPDPLACTKNKIPLAKKKKKGSFYAPKNLGFGAPKKTNGLGARFFFKKYFLARLAHRAPRLGQVPDRAATCISGPLGPYIGTTKKRSQAPQGVLSRSALSPHRRFGI